MARPHKCRRISRLPDNPYFKPAGIPLRQLKDITLTLDEYEALRLADLEKMYHESAAKEMGISRQTFGNILTNAHQKVADSIVNGKAIKIEGGVYQMDGIRIFCCRDCHHEWQLPFGTGRPRNCISCKSINIHRSPAGQGNGGENSQKQRKRNRRSP